MAKTFYVRTHAMTYYDNLIRVDEEEMQEYKNERPDLTEEEIVKEMFADENYELIDVVQTDWDNETVDEVQKCNDTEDEENV